MTTYSDIRDDVRSHLDESIARFWDDTELLRWSNEAARYIARRAECLPDRDIQNVVASKATYDAPTDMIRINTVEYWQDTSNIYTLEYVPFNQFQDLAFNSRNVVGNTPYSWSMWGYTGDQQTSQIYLYPISSQNITDGLVIYYYRYPHEMVEANDVLDLPGGWEDLIPLYVEMVARRKESKDPRWQEAKLLFEERLVDMTRATRLPTDQQTFFSGDRGRGGLPNWLVESDW